MAKLIAATSTTLKIVIIGAYVFGVVFCLAGVWLVYLGAIGDTQFSFFGQTFKSSNVGIAALFIGGVAVVLLLRRSLGTLEGAIRAETPKHTHDKAPLQHWPNKKTLATLRTKIKTLSDTQWIILNAVAERNGVAAWTLAEQLKVGPSIFYHRVNTLEQEELLILDDKKLYLASAVIAVAKGKSLADLRQ